MTLFTAVGSAAMIEAFTKLLPQSQGDVLTLPPTTSTATQSATQSQTQAQSQSQTQSQTQTKSSSSTSTSSSSQVPAGYILVAPMSALAGRSSAYFNHPTGGSCILLDYSGQWRAFSSVCTHAGCTVQFTGSSIYCPCHSGYFNPTNGAAAGGPVRVALAEYGVIVQNNNLYVSQARIN